MAILEPLKFGFVLVMCFLLSSCAREQQFVPEGCLTGVLTADGDTCQALKSNQSNKLYSFYSNMNGYQLGEEVCICGQVAQMTTCKTGTPIEVQHLDRSCPSASSKFNQFTFPLE